MQSVAEYVTEIETKKFDRINLIEDLHKINKGILFLNYIKHKGKENLHPSTNLEALFNKIEQYIEDKQECLYLKMGRNSKHFDIIPPTQESLSKYNSFIEQIKNHAQLNEIEKIALIYSTIADNLKHKHPNDIDEEKRILFKQKIQHPATIFTGEKSGVCLDRNYALFDIFKQIGIETYLMQGHLVNPSENHIWTRVNVNETNNTSYKIDLDLMLYNNFKILQLREVQF